MNFLKSKALNKDGWKLCIVLKELREAKFLHFKVRNFPKSTSELLSANAISIDALLYELPTRSTLSSIKQIETSSIFKWLESTTYDASHVIELI